MNVNVTSPSVPNQKTFSKYLKELYRTRMLTTNGKLVKKLENKLKKKFGLKYLLVTCNGTISLEIALKTLGIKRGVLTSPFSYVSTPNACKWLDLKVFFSDIETKKYTIDLSKTNQRVLNKVDCILPTHVFGIEANITKLCTFAKKNRKKVIFDAAHCFGVKFKKKSILNYGDASILSFQATKIFNTCEGGAVIFKKKSDYLYAKQLINIGYRYDLKKFLPKEGINAKMSELNAAWGLALLKNYKKIFKRKQRIYENYVKNLKDCKVDIINKDFQNNYNYVPVLFTSKKLKETVELKLKKKKIYARRYFYPSLNILGHFKYEKMSISEDISERILCLPIYENLNSKIINQITKIICFYEK